MAKPKIEGDDITFFSEHYLQHASGMIWHVVLVTNEHDCLIDFAVDRMTVCEVPGFLRDRISRGPNKVIVTSRKSPAQVPRAGAATHDLSAAGGDPYGVGRGSRSSMGPREVPQQVPQTKPDILSRGRIDDDGGNGRRVAARADNPGTGGTLRLPSTPSGGTPSRPCPPTGRGD